MMFAMLKPNGLRGWVVLGAVGLGLPLGCADEAAAPPSPTVPAADGPPPTPASTDAGAGDLVARDGFILPPLPPPNGPWPTWVSRDIGMVASPGRVWSGAGPPLRIQSGGTDIGGVADSFHFVSRQVAGDFEIVARIGSLQMASPDSTAGLMVRASEDDPAAANVFVGVLADRTKGGVLLQRSRSGEAAVTVVTDVGVRDGQWWLRLTRKGRTLTAYRSAMYRLNWTRIGSVDIDLPAEVVAGLAVASRNPDRPTVSEVTALRLQNLDSQPATRSWAFDEIGSVAVGGIATHVGDGLELAGLGEPLSLLNDSGVYAFQTAEGEQVLTVKVGAFTHPNPAARVGLMLREGPVLQFVVSRGGPAVVLTVTAEMGVQFMTRHQPFMMGEVTSVEAVKAPVWLRLTRTELPGQPAQSLVSGAYSIDGVQWAQVGSIQFSLPEPFLIGVHATSSGGSLPVASTLTELSLTRPTAAAPVADAGMPSGPADAAAIDAAAIQGGM
jgi:regulation of enolase protein 1 (concanavalin A-like superfamily)